MCTPPLPAFAKLATSGALNKKSIRGTSIMRTGQALLAPLLALGLTMCSQKNLPDPPVAKQKPVSFTLHGVTITDEYAWLRDPNYPDVTDPEILDYLRRENAYFNAVMAPHQDLVDRLYAEMKGRIKQADDTAPVKDGPYLYFRRFAQGAQYAAWLRRPVEGGREELLIDENALAQGHEYFDLRSLRASPDHRLIAYSTDDDGSERYVIQVKDVGSGGLLPERIENTDGSLAWGADGKTLYYVELNENLNPVRLRAHTLGNDPGADPVLYDEPDAGFSVDLSKSRSGRFLMVSTGDHVTSEVRVLDLDGPDAALRVIAPRKVDHYYDVEHCGDNFLIRTNDSHRNFRIVSAPVAAPSPDNWKEVIAPDDDHYLASVDCFADFYVVVERSGGLVHMRVRGYGGDEHEVAFPEEAYWAEPGDTRDFATDRFRIVYSSLVTPRSDMDYHVASHRLETVKVEEIPSGYDAGQYVTRRLWASAPDGVKVPITIVHRKGFPRDGSGRLYLTGYGSYGYSNDPIFRSRRLSLLDRGFAFAIAHIRGGGEMGRWWYEDGKLAKKTNTFTDFIAAAQYLIAQGYARPEHIAIAGRSAGGLLMGAVTNMRPDLFRTVVAGVPFVDVLNTMLDDSLWLTPKEFPEWGNPKTDAQAFKTIRAYAPYENVRAQDYPNLFVTAGLNDPRVTYWEPAKWVARLRARKTDDNLIVLRTEMSAGHRGASGRFESLHERAQEYAFVLMTLGVED